MPKGKSSELSDKRYKALIQHSHEGIVIYNAQGTIQYASPGIIKVVGYTDKELIGRNGKELFHKDDLEDVKDIFNKVLSRPNKSLPMTQRIRHKKGYYFWAECQLTNLFHIAGINGILSNFWNINGRKIAEHRLLETQHLLETINQNLSEGIFMGVLEKEFLYANNAFLKMFGFRSFKELLQKKPKQLFADKSLSKETIKKVLRKGSVRNVEVWLKKNDGERFLGRLSISQISFRGIEHCFVGSVRDVTQQKKVKQELINSHNFLQNVINTVAAPIFVKDRKHRWILFNDAFVADFAEPQKAKFYRGKTDHDFLPKRLADQIWKIDNEVFRTGRTISTQEMLPGKREKIVITTKSLFVDDKGEKFIIGFIMDITDQKRFEGIIKSINAGLRGILESTKDEILAIDRDCCYTMFNQAHARAIKHLTGNDIKIGDNLFSVLPKSLTKVAKQNIARALMGEQFTIELPLPNKTVMKISFNAIRDEKGKVTGVALFAEDFTKRKITEARLKALNDELTEQNWQLASQEEDLKIALDQLSERNFELDQLMYKTSHDLRSPLSSILGLVNLANLDNEPSHLREYLGKIEGRIKKLDEFITSMLSYARVNRGDINVTRIDLEEVVRTAIKELEYLENFKSIKTRIDIKNREIPFSSDLFRIKIIFSNIISNAYKYYNPEVESFLKIKIVISPEAAAIEFRDNGIGIKNEHKDKIFNMFFRATDRAHGSGLGMYIVKQAVEKLNGQVTIKSVYAAGTDIKIVIPNEEI